MVRKKAKVYLLTVSMVEDEKKKKKVERKYSSGKARGMVENRRIHS